jgi:hypothetical protein
LTERITNALGKKPVGANADAGTYQSAPRTFQGTVDPLPPALRPLAEQARWVVWKWQLSKKGKWTKVPKQAAHPQYNAQTNRSGTWSDYGTAISSFKNRIRGVDGIGYMLHDGDVAALDLDKCRDINTEKINDWAQRLVEKARALNAYVEITPSGTGLRIIGRCVGIVVHRKFSDVGNGSSSVELYRKCQRYITISGAELGACTELANIDGLIDEVFAEYENKPSGETRTASATTNAEDAEDNTEKPIPPNLLDLVRNGVEEGRRSEQFFRVVADLKQLGWTSEAITQLFEGYPNGIAAKYAGRIRTEVERVHSKIEEQQPVGEGVSLDDFHAYMPAYTYIYAPTGEMWPAASVNAKIPSGPVLGADGKPALDAQGKQKSVKATVWLVHNKSIEQMTWAPGLPSIIRNRLISDGGWIDRAKVSCFNLYRPPLIKFGNAAEANRWLELVHKIYDDEAEHIIKWLAHRVQRPGEKINHALLFGGNQGIGKDTTLEPVKHAVGPWNFA